MPTNEYNNLEFDLKEIIFQLFGDKGGFLWRMFENAGIVDFSKLDNAPLFLPHLKIEGMDIYTLVNKIKKFNKEN